MTATARRRRALGGVLAAVLVVSAACGGGGDDAAGDLPDVLPLSDSPLPGRVLGLVVDREDIAGKLADVGRAYVTEVGLFSLREEGPEPGPDDDILQATVQYSRLAPDVDASDPVFQQAIVNQVGTRTPRPLRMGDTTVYLVGDARRGIAVFFTGDAFVVVATREGFPQQRSLLRELVELDL